MIIKCFPDCYLVRCRNKAHRFIYGNVVILAVALHSNNGGILH